MSQLEIQPLTPERWPDLEALFGARGAAGGCWCMWWRVKASDWDRSKGEPNRAAFRSIVDAGPSPGLLAYVDGQPAGWCAVAPRTQYPRLERSRLLKPVDDQPVWSVVCFFVGRQHRSRGVGGTLLKAAGDFAAAGGATILEGYPEEPRRGRTADASAWNGVPSMFVAAGFQEVARPAPGRPIMRKQLTSQSRATTLP